MKVLLILVILFNSSCIHVASTEYASIDLENTKTRYLDDNNQTIQALNFRQIPHHYQRFSSDAIFANTINIGVVVVSTIVGLAALEIVFKDVPIANVSSGQKWNSRYDKSGARIREENSEILNEARKTTQINYKKYLLSERVIEPNQSVQGLIFFKKEPTNQKIFLKYYPRN